MTDEYVTSETNLPPDPEGEEIRLQITDKRTKEISSTRARISRTADDLSDPAPLTVVKGPHENTEEQWYIDVLETGIDSEEIDRDLLEEAYEEVKNDANIINTRSDDVKTLLRYLVEKGQYSSVSQASRTIMYEYLSDRYPELLDEYVDVKVRLEQQELTDGRRDST